MINFEEIINEFLFKSKEIGRKDFLELTKASSIVPEVREDAYGYVDFEIIINIDRIVFNSLKEIISDYYEFSRMFFTSKADESSGISIVTVQPVYEKFVDWDAIRGIETKDSLLSKVKAEKDIFESLITLDTEIPEDEYLSLHSHIIKCMRLAGVSYPNKLKSYKEIVLQLKSVATDRGSYDKRRRHINDLYKDIIETLENSIDDSSEVGGDFIPTGWANIDKSINLILASYRSSSEIIEFNGVGNMLRKLMKDLAELVYIDEIHRPSGVSEPIQASKYKNRFLAYFAKSFPTESNDEYRDLAKKAADVADKVSHSVDSKYKLELAVECTLFLVKIVKIADLNIQNIEQ